jgi:hypothetical protein
LIQQIQSYCQRYDADFVAQIPAFITYGVTQISKDLEILGAVQVIEGVFTPDNPVFTKPTLWLNNVRFSVFSGENNSETFVTNRSYPTAVEYQNEANQTGLPQYYADWDAEHWLISPTPDQAYRYQVSYFRQFLPLDPTEQTNWLTQNDPISLLLACLVQASIWTGNADMLAMVQQQYITSIGSLIARDKSRMTDQYSKREKV